jgi:hypothetical protein
MKYIRQTKPCPKCQTTKPIDEFYFNKVRQVYLSWCKSCGKTRAVQTRKDLRESRSPEDLLTKRFYDLISSAMQRKKKGVKIPFSLTVKDVRKKYQEQKGKCFYTGVTMKIRQQDEKERNLFAMSLDRINSTEGYTPTNVVLCCWGINSFKGVETVSGMYEALKMFYETAVQHNKF